VILVCCCIWLRFNWYYDGLQEVLRPYSPVCSYVSWPILISSVMAPSSRLWRISAGVYCFSVVVFNSSMAALSLSFSTSGPMSSSLSRVYSSSFCSSSSSSFFCLVRTLVTVLKYYNVNAMNIILFDVR